MRLTSILSICIFCGLMFHACTSENIRPDDALGTARAFIRHSLDGEFKQANELILRDSLNLKELTQMEKDYKNDLSKDDRKSYQKASIVIHSIDQASDSVVVINYSNSFRKKQTPIKVIRKDNMWQIDLK